LHSTLKGSENSRQAMFFLQQSPAAPLDRFIESMWLCRNYPGPRALHRILPTGTAGLIINLKEDQTRMYTGKAGGLHCDVLPGSVLSGVASRFQIIDTDEQEYVAGVSFRPGGTIGFFAPPASHLRDADVPLEALWGARATARLRDQLLSAPHPAAALNALETALHSAMRPQTPHPAVAFSLEQFSAQPSMVRIAAVASAIGLSHKRFVERFKLEVGVAPKRYCRILRFQRAVARAHRMEQDDWCQLALECGYFDQAHFVHDFQAFAGLAPLAYQALRTPFQNHVNFLQSDQLQIG
jgi:AraC-like DNA-binding protein